MQKPREYTNMQKINTTARCMFHEKIRYFMYKNAKMIAWRKRTFFQNGQKGSEVVGFVL